MPAYRVSVPHAVGREVALERVRQFLDDVRREHADKVSDVRGQWSENRLDFAFSTIGLGIQGTLVVEEEIVQVFGPLPLAAAFFRGRIEQTIRQQLESLLGSA
jgi:hypothetical protein